MEATSFTHKLTVMPIIYLILPMEQASTLLKDWMEFSSHAAYMPSGCSSLVP